MANSVGATSQQDKTKLLNNGALVHDLYQCIKYGGESLDHVPALVLKLIKSGGWRGWIDPNTGEIFTFETFAEFITAETGNGGLGTTIQMIQDICQRNTRAAQALTLALKEDAGGDRQSKEYKTIVYNVNNGRPVGNSKQAGLRRLAKEAENCNTAKVLQAQVLNEQMTVNAALVELGIRPKTLTITLDPEKIATKLKQRLTPDQIKELITLLK